MSTAELDELVERTHRGNRSAIEDAERRTDQIERTRREAEERTDLIERQLGENQRRLERLLRKFSV